MKSDLLITGISQLVTAEGAGPKRGAAMRAVKVVERAALAVSSGVVTWVGEERNWSGDAARKVNADGCAVVPGLVDPHTHAVWAGDRLNDFEARSAGATYEMLQATGGGIRRTIRATGAVSVDKLATLAKPRLDALIRSGATTIEVKSGYGFTTAGELTMLEAIRSVSAMVSAKIVPTLLIHVPPVNAGQRPRYLTEVCGELIPETAIRKLATAVDVFVENEAWSVAEAERILDAAKRHGLAVKLHADQFHALGGVEMGARCGALSVDHLEASGPEQIAAIAASPTIATILPGVSLHLGTAAARGRELVDAGAAVAIGTDLNPGSSPLFSTSLALALAVRLNGLTAQEALVAGTINAACALGLPNIGRLEAGCAADFLVLDSSDWRELVYPLGANPVREVWVGGRKACG
ncbi:MAG: imidazolonepropionase [Acidobacteriaceae bacterium]